MTTSKQAKVWMEGRFAYLEERLRMMTLEMESLQLKNEALRQKSASSREDAAPSHKEEKRKMHHDLRNLTDKYKEMVKRIGTALLVDHLFNSTNMPYSAEIMVVPLSPKFKISQIKLYDKSKDPVEHMETFKTHMTLYSFSGEIVCQAFPLTLKGVTRGLFGAL